MREQCEDCPLKTGQIPRTVDGMKAMSKRLEVVEKRCESRPPLCAAAINSKVGWKVFWPIVIIFVGITSGTVTFISSSNASYQRDHGAIHKEINTEIKMMNRDLYQEIRQISGDIKAIKVKIENGGG